MLRHVPALLCVFLCINVTSLVICWKIQWESGNYTDLSEIKVFWQSSSQQTSCKAKAIEGNSLAFPSLQNTTLDLASGSASGQWKTMYSAFIWIVMDQTQPRYNLRHRTRSKIFISKSVSMNDRDFSVRMLCKQSILFTFDNDTDVDIIALFYFFHFDSTDVSDAYDIRLLNEHMWCVL